MINLHKRGFTIDSNTKDNQESVEKTVNQQLYEDFRKRWEEDKDFRSMILLAIGFPIFFIFSFISLGFQGGVNVMINGFITGTALALLALGFSVIFGTARMFKLSIGGYYVLGAFATFWFFSAFDLDFNEVLNAPLSDFDGFKFKLIIFLPYLILSSTLIYFIRNSNLQRKLIYVLSIFLALGIHTGILLALYTFGPLQALFYAAVISSSILLFIMTAEYLELSERQIFKLSIGIHTFMLLANSLTVGSRSFALYFAVMIYSILIVSVVSMLVDKYILEEIRETPTNVLIVTFAIALLIQSWLAEISFPRTNIRGELDFQKFGIEPRNLDGLNDFTDRIEIFGVRIQMLRVVATIGAFILIIATIYFINRTSLGLAMLAVSQDEDAANLMGIDVTKVYMVATGIGMGLAAAAAILISPYEARPYWGIYMGYAPLITAIAVVTVGGIGSIAGSVVAGFLIGYAQTYVGQIEPEYSVLVPLVVIFLVMLVRPEGLFGRSEEES